MTKQEAIDILNKTYSETLNRIGERYWQPIYSIKTQLEYLLAAINDKNDKSKLKDIIIGIYAMREFDNVDDYYADLLYKSADISDKIEQGFVFK